jgi:uncharacterized protein (DUF58 family)
MIRAELSVALIAILLGGISLVHAIFRSLQAALAKRSIKLTVAGVTITFNPDNPQEFDAAVLAAKAAQRGKKEDGAEPSIGSSKEGAS